MTAPKAIRQLVEHFEQNKDELRSGRYNEATDSQIDRLMYEMYGLTEEEIRIGEGGY